MYTTKKSWDGARAACLDVGADLLTLRSKTEENEVRNKLKEINLHSIYFWLGRCNYGSNLCCIYILLGKNGSEITTTTQSINNNNI